ncbi:MAG: ABC transporter ATP-binding protein [Deltaproteobacteria bacterium]|nr:ABC transporter ATP-binding protein [Deltaproteobacteria bacterium]
MLLKADDLSVFYGSVQALRGVSFTVGRGEIVSLVGANGAGKSTTLRTLSGVLRASSGSVVFDGSRIDGLPPHRIVRRGIAHVPEGRGIFANMTVRENLDMGAYARPSRKEAGESLERVFALFPRLSERAGQVAGTLSGGEQQMLAIGRAMMQRPALLLLDEPSMGLSPLLVREMGLSPLLVREIFRLIVEINRSGTTILLVEQNAAMALAAAGRAYVLETGAIALQGAASDLRKDPKVRAAYLGEEPRGGFPRQG